MANGEKVVNEGLSAGVAGVDGNAVAQGSYVASAPHGLSVNGIAYDPRTGFVYVLHADGVNWTSAAKLTDMTHQMLLNYPPPVIAVPDSFKARFVEAVKLREVADAKLAELQETLRVIAEQKTCPGWSVEEALEFVMLYAKNKLAESFKG